MKPFLSLLCLLPLAACALQRPAPLPSPPSPIIITPAPSAAEELATEKQATALSKASAAVAAAQVAGGQLAESNAAAAVNGELGVASANLPAPTDADRAEALARTNAALAGDLATARAGWDSARSEAERLRAELGAARLAAERERAESAARMDAREKEYAAKFAALTAAAQAARDEERNSVLRAQVAWLNRIGFICMAITIGALGIGLALGGIAALKRVGPLSVVSGVGAALCFGAAQIVGAWWFPWAVGLVVLAAIAWFSVWAWKHQKRGDLATELAARTAKVAAVARTAVPVLDSAYDSASTEVKAWLDEHVFSRLSSTMNRDEKAAVHEIRAGA